MAGVITNRVKVKRVRAKRTAAPPKTFARLEPGKRGTPYKVICISIYEDDLQLLDALAERLRHSRSALVRLLVRAEAAR